MNRFSCMQRANWTEELQKQGLVYTKETDPSDPFHHYWREGWYYTITMADYTALKTAAEVVFDRYVKAGDYMVEHPELLSKIGIPEWAHAMVIKTWDTEVDFGSVYGRFDFRFGGVDHAVPSMRIPKLYEFNADTPTGLVESTAIQWEWHLNLKMGADQWNFAYEMLVEAWKRNMPLIEESKGFQERPVVYFAVGDGQGSFEDEMNCLQIKSACEEAGYKTQTIFMERIKLGDDGRFYDEQDEHIDVIFKLYPWETMVTEPNGQAMFEDMAKPDGTVWIEPPYKMLWSNKATLAILWELFKDDKEAAQYLLPTFFEDDDHPEMPYRHPELPYGYARKPFLSREGANVTLVGADGEVIEEGEDKDYGSEGFVLQALAEPPVFLCPEHGLVQPVIGVWMIDGEPHGMLIRESGGSVTDDFANFVPHTIIDGEIKGVHKPVAFK